MDEVSFKISPVAYPENRGLVMLFNLLLSLKHSSNYNQHSSAAQFGSANYCAAPIIYPCDTTVAKCSNSRCTVCEPDQEDQGQ